MKLVTFRLSEEQIAQLRQTAKELGVSMTDVVRLAIKAYTEKAE